MRRRLAQHIFFLLMIVAWAAPVYAAFFGPAPDVEGPPNLQMRAFVGALLQIGGALTLGAFAALLFILIRRESGARVGSIGNCEGGTMISPMMTPLLGIWLFPREASTVAPEIDHLFFLVLGISAFFATLITTLMLVFIIRYRRRDPDETGADLPSPLWMEVTWTVIPTIIMLVMFVLGAKLYLKLSRAPANAIEIAVIGKQWMWQLQHPSGKKEINSLHMPIGVPIKLVMTSQDVIHDFDVPAFRVKQDVLPGRYSMEWFTATELGTFHLFCATYCGTGHSHMGGMVTVMTKADYARWLATDANDDDPVAAGSKLFVERGCISCHGQQGPTMAGLYGSNVRLDGGKTVVADEDYLRESILYPQAKIVAGYKPIMPSFRNQLTEGQIYQLIAYIKSLRVATGEGSNDH